MVQYMRIGAQRSWNNAELWFRYLRKIVDGDHIRLTPEQVRELIESGDLSMFQIVTLKRAVTPGTVTNRRVSERNHRTQTPMVKELLKRHGRA